MNEVFHGWRRKAGLFILLLGCALTGGWLRSLHYVDLMQVSVGKARYSFVSGGGKCLFVSGRRINLTRIDRADRIEIRLLPAPHDEDAPRQSWVRFSSPDIWIHPSSADDMDEFGMHPYLSIVLPLILVSTCMIVKMPRGGGNQSNPKFTPSI